MKQLTRWLPEKDMLKSEYGETTYKQYLNNEIARRDNEKYIFCIKKRNYGHQKRIALYSKEIESEGINETKI